MKKQEQIKNRTWEYFWQQKSKELSIFIIVIGVVFMFCLILAVYLYAIPMAITIQLFGDDNLSNDFTTVLFLWIIVSMIILWIILWIKSNWNKAEERAKEDFK